MNYTHTPRITAFNNDVSTATVTQFSIKKKKASMQGRVKLRKLWCQVREHSTQNPWHNLHKRSCLTLDHWGATILHCVRNHLSSETVSHSQAHWNEIRRTGSSPLTEHPETAMHDARKAVTMTMITNFWNIIPPLRMNPLTPSPFRHTKACTSSGHAFGMLVTNCNISSKPTDRNNFTVVSVLIQSHAKEYICCFLTVTYTEINNCW